ncbi:MAG TPA: hypothetical protein PKJ08_02225 [Candidatus Cloacimonadota bacterium]|nr:hypothetical protein [Candidatus Cloacimonadota bacterium]HPM00614.1 hypothetical protein [Candidatus Cloacimonadota bacterium]
MATLVRNIGSLDARNASKEVIEQIKKIKNVGSLIVSKDNRPFFMKIEMENIGSTMEMDKDVKLHVGPFEFTKELLESAPKAIKMAIVGPVSFSRDISPELMEEKIEWLNVIGPVQVYEQVSGIMMSKMHDSVGPIDVLKAEEFILKGHIRIDQYFLKNMEDNSIIKCSGTLELDEDVNLKVFDQKIKQIEIGRKLSIYDDQKEYILKKIYENTDAVTTEINIGIKPAQYKFKENLSSKLVILKRNCHYLKAGTKLDAFNLMNVKKAEISSDGIIILAENISNDLLNEKKIIFSSAKRIYFPNTLNQTMLQYLNENTEGVPYDIEKTVFINGSQKISATRCKIIKDQSVYIVFGELKLTDDCPLELIDQKFSVLDNYGSIESSSDICSIIQEKIRYNEGSVESHDSNSEDDNEDLSQYNNVIQNAGSYQL